MTKQRLPLLSIMGLSLAVGAFGTPALAGEPAGIGERGTGQLQKSTEREQSQNKPDLSQAQAELEEGKTAQAMNDLTHEERDSRKAIEPAGIGEKGTGQTQKSTERQQSRNQEDLSQASQELRGGKTAQAMEEQLKHEK